MSNISIIFELDSSLDIFDKLLIIGIEEGWHRSVGQAQFLKEIACRLQGLSDVVALEANNLLKLIEEFGSH